MLKAVKIKLYPNKDQKIYINKLLGTSRFIYNQCLNYKINQYKESKKSVSFGELGKYLVSLKLTHEWIKESHSKVLQQSLINMDKAFKNFFRTKKGFPQFKSKHQKQSCRFPVDAISGVKGNRLNIIRSLWDIHYKCSSKDMRYLNKNKKLIKSGTLSKTKSGDYYFSILIDKPNKKLNIPTNDVVGLDLGVKIFIITSEGQGYDNLNFKKTKQKRLNKLHRELSRKQKGSSNRKKARIKLAKLYEKINNKKEYYLHSVVNQLLNESQVIVIEDLNVKGMLKNRQLSKSIQEVSFNRFKEILRYKAKWYERELVEVSRWFPSSKLCNGCGYKNKELTLKDRKWVCPECDARHDRDLNAAINIKNEGKRIKVGMSLPESTPLESKSPDTRRIRKQKIGSLSLI